MLVNVTKKIRVTSEAFRSSKEWWPSHLVKYLMKELRPMLTARRRVELANVSAMATVR